MFKKLSDNWGALCLSAFGGVLALAPSVAFADVPAGVEAKIESITTDIGSIAVMVLGITMAVVSATWLIRMVKKG